MSKKFVASNPMYCVIAGAKEADVSDIEKATRGTFAAARKLGRNPVLVGINDNAVSMVAQTVAEDQRVPVMFGTVADITKDLDGRRLRKDHIQVILFQTPEYAGSDEAYDLLCGCRQFGGTLRMFSVFHGAWLGSQWNKPWVREFNDRFLKTLNSYSMSAEEKKALFAERMFKLQKYPANALFERKQNAQPSAPKKAPELPTGIPMSNMFGNIPRSHACGCLLNETAHLTVSMVRWAVFVIGISNPNYNPKNNICQAFKEGIAMKLFSSFTRQCSATLPEVRKTVRKTLSQMGLDTKTTKVDTYIVVNGDTEIGTISVKVTPRQYTLVISDSFGVLVMPIHPMYNGKKWKQDIMTRVRYAAHEMRCRWTPEGHRINERFNDILRQTAMIDEVDFAKTGKGREEAPLEIGDGACLPPHYATALYMGLLDF